MVDGSKILGGYVLLPRKLLESDLMKRPAWEFRLWVWIIAKAEHRPRSEGRKLDRGQLFTTIEEMRDVAGHMVGRRPVKPDRGAIAKALRRLRESNRITTTKTTRGTIISINNYGFYQTPANYESNTQGRAKAERRLHEGRNDRQEGKKKGTRKKKGAATPPALPLEITAPRALATVSGNTRPLLSGPSVLKACRDVFPNLYHVRLGLDYRPGAGTARDNMKLRELQAAEDGQVQLREFMRRGNLMFDHLQDEFRRKVGAGPEANKQAGAIASICNLCAYWQRYSVPPVSRGAAAKAFEQDPIALANGRKLAEQAEAERALKVQ